MTLEAITRKAAKQAGLKRYFTGAPCRHGHVAERFVSTRMCAACLAQRAIDEKDERLAASRAYHEANRDEINRRGREWRANNPEKARAATAAWRVKNREVHQRITREWQARNAARIQAARTLRHSANPETRKASVTAWKQRNPEKWNAIKSAAERNRRARKRAAEGRHTAADIALIFKAQRGWCAHCRASIKTGWHVDHITPLARGGSNWPRNLQLLCATCNQRKHARDPITFAQMEGRLI